MYSSDCTVVLSQANTKGWVLLMNAATWHASGAYPGPQGSDALGNVPRVALLLAFAPPFLESIQHVFGKHNRAYSPSAQLACEDQPAPFWKRETRQTSDASR